MYFKNLELQTWGEPQGTIQSNLIGYREGNWEANWLNWTPKSSWHCSKLFTGIILFEVYNKPYKAVNLLSHFSLEETEALRSEIVTPNHTLSSGEHIWTQVWHALETMCNVLHLVPFSAIFFLSLIYRRGNWGTEEGNLLVFIQLVRGRSYIWIWFGWP